jgi:hypothetical protein
LGNNKGIISVGGASIATGASGFTWDIVGGDISSDILSVYHADATQLLTLKNDKTIESLVDFIVNTDTLYVSATTNKVGIGVTIPTQELDVVGNAQVSGQVLLGAGTIVLPSLSFTSNTSVGIRLNGGNNISFVSGGTDKMIISNTGIVSVVQAAYEALVVNDNNIPNKKYVDDSINSAMLSGAKLYFFGFGS